MFHCGSSCGYMLMFWLARTMSYLIVVLAIWGLIDPRKFFGGRVYALVGLFMAFELYIVSMVVGRY